MVHSFWRVHWKNNEREGFTLVRFHRKGKFTKSDIENYQKDIQSAFGLKVTPAILRLEKL